MLNLLISQLEQIEEHDGSSLDVLVAGFASVDAAHREWLAIAIAGTVVTFLVTVRFLKPVRHTKQLSHSVQAHKHGR